MIKYLATDKYTGVDLSEERVRIAKEYVEHEGLNHKNPEFFANQSDNSLSFLPDEHYDFIWSFAVLMHMPFSEVEKCLVELKKKLKPKGVIMADYCFHDFVKKDRVSAYWVPKNDMKKLVEKLGMTYHEVEGAFALISPNRSDHAMMRLSISDSN